MTEPEHSREAIEQRTRQWLEDSYRRGMASIAGDYEPVWDANGQPCRMSRYHFQELQRKLKIFRWLDRLHFDSFIDVGSGFDIYPKLVHERYGAGTFFSDFTHAMNLPYGGAASGRLDRAVTLNAARLPFADGTFDVVLASEVLEHLVRPIETIAELVRVSRKYVIMTSLEALSANWWERLRQHLQVDVSHEHVERNFFLLPELDAIFGPHWWHENLLFDPNLPARSFDSEEHQQAVYGSIRDRDTLVAALHRAVAINDHRPGAMGILLVKSKQGVAPPAARHEDGSALATWLVDRACELERFMRALARQFAAGTVDLPEKDRPIAAPLLEVLRCPDCRGRLDGRGAGLRCGACNASYAGEFGVPIVYPRRLPDGPETIEESVRGLCGDDRRRAAIVRRLARKLRRNERPPGALRSLLQRVIARAG
jgi:SAM-dependent methyltransferase/uncharacterized protein YbaR (Trm112 family)